METFEKPRSYQPVSEAYAGRSIFVTGGTGFLGKVFVEKLLYSCPKISKIYLLVRQKKNINADERIKKMLDLPVFNRLKNERPDDLKKLIPIYGDITHPKLGMKPEDEVILINSVSMVFHIAATVKFFEPLEKALNINFKGTKYVLELCHKIKNIKAFIYVSTVYSNPDVNIIEEIIYPSPVPLEEAEELTKRTNFSHEETMELLNRGKKPNTYTFTKALAENLVLKNHGNIPTTIIRPSIVVSSKAEPVTGWVDNWYGASGILLPIAERLNKIILTNCNNVIDLIPVDYVTNLIIVAGAKCERPTEVLVYNSCTACENPITMGQLIEISTKASIAHTQSISLVSKALMTESDWILYIITILQRIPAMILDFILYISGKQTKYVKDLEKAIHYRDGAEYFTSRTWRNSAERTCTLFESLSETDQKCFAFDPRSIVWAEFIPDYLDGMRKYLSGKL